MQKQPQAGFTLLEVLLVVLLMGLAAAAVTLSVSNKGIDSELRQQAQQFIASVEVGLDEVVLNGQFAGIVIEEDRYQFVVFYDNQWLPIPEDKFLTERMMPEGISLSLTVDGLPLSQEDERDESLFEEEFEEADVGLSEDKDDKQYMPQVFLFPSGELSQFELDFIAEEDAQQPETIVQTVYANILGQLSLEPFDTND